MYHALGQAVRRLSRKSIIALFLLMVESVCGLVTVVQAAEVVVRLHNPPREGTVVFLLFDSANTFGDLRDPAKTLRYPADGQKAYPILDVLPGEYALLVYYDENGNGRLDENFLGIPTEPVGFSNRYRPKGPPSYSRASFQLEEGEMQTFDVALRRPLGKWGRLGIGVGVIFRSSPYHDYDGNVFRIIPAVTYMSERLQLYGPNLQIGIARIGDLALAMTARFRIGVYEENDSPSLAGMGDRKDTLMAGLALEYDLPGGVELFTRYEHDILNRIGGGSAKIGVKKSFQWGITRLSPKIALNWLSSELANHDFGVPNDKARANRPACRLDDTFSIEVGIGSFIELSRNWRAVINIDVEFLDDETMDSPIVSGQHVTKGFAALNYVF